MNSNKLSLPDDGNDNNDYNDKGNSNDYDVDYNDNDNVDNDNDIILMMMVMLITIMMLITTISIENVPKDWQFLSNADIICRVEKLNILEDSGYRHTE